METRFLYGATGSGKSMLGCYYACKHHYVLNRRILGNVHYNIPNSVFIEPIDIIMSLDTKRTNESKYAELLNNNEPKTLIVDEIGKWWNNRNHQSLTNKVLGYFVDQCRKRNIKLIVIDQHVSGFDVKGRDHVEYLIRCWCDYIPDTDVPWYFNYISFSRNNNKTSGFRLPAQYMIKTFGQLYDTEEHVTPMEYLTEDKALEDLIVNAKGTSDK